MIGFICMIKLYDKKPTSKNIQNWIDKYRHRYPEKFKPEIYMELDSLDMFDKETRFCVVDKRFKSMWERRRKFSLVMISFGLFLQIMPFVL